MQKPQLSKSELKVFLEEVKNHKQQLAMDTYKALRRWRDFTKQKAPACKREANKAANGASALPPLTADEEKALADLLFQAKALNYEKNSKPYDKRLYCN